MITKEDALEIQGIFGADHNRQVRKKYWPAWAYYIHYISPTISLSQDLADRLDKETANKHFIKVLS